MQDALYLDNILSSLNHNDSYFLFITIHLTKVRSCLCALHQFIVNNVCCFKKKNLVKVIQILRNEKKNKNNKVTILNLLR